MSRSGSAWGYRHGCRGTADAALEARTRGRPEAQARPIPLREEIAILEAWSEAGAPKGDPRHMPPPPRFPEGWKLGTPDLVLEPAESFSIPASGPDTYRCFVIPTNLARNTYISALDIWPGNPRVVHHINAFLDRSGDARKRDWAEQGPGYTSFSGPGIEAYEDLSFWAAGHEPSHFPTGIGQRLSRQSDVVLQIHYHPTGKPEVDRTRIGVYYSREPVKQALHWSTVSNSDFHLPAGDPNVEVKASWLIPVDVEVLAISPHMHQLGRDMSMSVTVSEWSQARLDQYPGLGSLLAERLFLPAADSRGSGLGRQGDCPLR